MNLRQFYTGRTIGIVAVLVALGLFAGLDYLYKAKHKPYQASLSGEYTCLPLAEVSEEQVQECTLGLKVDSGEYYVVDLTPMPDVKDIPAESKISATGMVAPIGWLRTDGWKKYEINGVFTVTGSLEIKSPLEGEMGENMEGEADPSRMSLGMHTWTWFRTTYGTSKVVIPKGQKAFTITFKDNGTFEATTDCNGLVGKYAVKKDAIVFSDLASTLTECVGSQEAEFNAMVRDSATYQFTSRGELIFDMEPGNGEFIFR